MVEDELARGTTDPTAERGELMAFLTVLPVISISKYTGELRAPMLSHYLGDLYIRSRVETTYWIGELANQLFVTITLVYPIIKPFINERPSTTLNKAGITYYWNQAMRARPMISGV